MIVGNLMKAHHIIASLRRKQLNVKIQKQALIFFNLLEEGRRKTALVVPIIKLMLINKNQLAPLINFLDSLETFKHSTHQKEI